MEAKKVSHLTETGTSGLRQWSGYIREEFIRALQGRDGARVYREMAENDAVVGAALAHINQALLSAKWSVTPADDSTAADDAAAFVTSVMDGMEITWEDFLEEVFSMLIYGYAPFEMVFARRAADGKIGLRKLALRGQDTVLRWSLDPSGAVTGLVQLPWDRPQVEIPAEKLMIFRTGGHKANPEGKSILRSAYRSWYFKRRVEEIEGIGIERDLAGLPVMLLPSSIMQQAGSDPASRTVLTAYQNLARDIRRDEQEGVVLPSDRDPQGNLLYELKLLSTGGTRQFDTTSVIDRYNKQIALSTLTDFMFLGHGATGSRALSTNKTDLFHTAMQGHLSAVAATLNRVLMPLLWRLNGMPAATMPAFAVTMPDRTDIRELGDYLSKLAAVGMPLFPDDALDAHLRTVAGLPERTEETAPATPAKAGDDASEEGDEAP
jgi:hypothetical protein